MAGHPSIAGRWHLVAASTPVDRLPSHRVDFVFRDGPTGVLGAVVLRGGRPVVAASASASDNRPRSGDSMKAYLVSTCAIFGVIAVLHALRAIVEWPMLSTDPVYFFTMLGLGLLAGALAVWSWRLLRARSDA